MASLTTDQIAILRWIVDSGEDTVMFAEGPGWATVVAGSANLVNVADIRELEAQGLIRLVRGHLYDLTNAGRAIYVELTTSLPPEREPPGFRKR